MHEDDIVVKTTPILATHLDAPLRSNKIKRCIYRLSPKHKINNEIFRHTQIDKFMTRELRELTFSYNLTPDPHKIGFQGHRQTLLDKIDVLFSDELTTPMLKKYLGVSINNISHQILGLNDSVLTTSPSIPSLQDVVNHEAFNDLRQAFKVKTLLEQGVVITAVNPSLSAKRLKYGWKEIAGNGAMLHFQGQDSLFVGRHISMLVLDNQTWSGSREHFLELNDVFAQRFMVLLSSILSDLMKIDGYIPWKLLKGIFLWGDAIIEEQGNDGFKSLSMWESLMIGTIMKVNEDPYVDNTDFYNKMKSDFIKLHPSNSGFIAMLEKLLSPVNDSFVLVQLFGLYRIWGHPTVCAKEGIKKLKQYACKKRPLNYSKINLISRKFKEYFCVSYYKKNSMWPQLDTSNLPSCSILKSILEKNIPLDTKREDYNLEDWDFIKSSKTFEIPKQYDISEMISDKAMSYGLTKLIDNINSKKTIGKAVDRSVLISWIKSDLGDPEEFLKNIDLNGFPSDEVVVGVCPKERELKVSARLFGLLTLVKRMYVVITEALIADNILPCFNEITMLDDQTSLLGKQYNVTKSMGNPSSKDVKIIINSDFEKWNSNMREEETKEIFQFMDGLFGFKNVISRSHEMFSKSQLYLADGTYCPKVENGKLVEDDYVWSNHIGGIEGLRQKGWTVWTVVMLKFIIELTGVKATIMGQGDNQVIVCSYSKKLGSENIKKKHTHFLQTLEDFLSDIGPPLKREETWNSSNVFAYGKYTIIKGVPHPMSQKKISRMMKLSNEGFPTITSCLSSLSASVFDSSWADINGLIPFMCYSFEAANALDFHINESLLGESYASWAHRLKKMKIPDGQGGQYHLKVPMTTELYNQVSRPNNSEFLEALLLFPNSLGGYPISLYGDILIRGFPDPVTAHLAQLQSIIKHVTNPILKDRLKNIIRPLFNPVKNYGMLFESPTSINLLTVSAPADQIKRKVYDLIVSPSFPKSTQFQNFVNKAEESLDEQIEALSNMTPKLNPRMASEILDATIPKRAQSMINRIERTNTMINVMVTTLQQNLIKSLATSECNLFLSVINQLVTPNRLVEIQCSTKMANYMRKASWSRDITGVTTASPLEFGQVLLNFDGSCTEECPYTELGKVLVKSLLAKDQSCYRELGPSAPYFGRRTLSKIVGSFSSPISKLSSPLLRKNANAMQFINWGVDEKSNLASLIIQNLESVTDLPPYLLMVKEKAISGTLEHREQDTHTKHGCYNPFIYSSSSHISANTSTLTEYSKGSGNVNLSFQSILIALQSSFAISPWYEQSAHFHIKCPSCIVPIYEGKLDIPIIPKKLNSYPNDPSFWISSSSVSMVQSASAPMYPLDESDIINVTKKEFTFLVAIHYVEIVRKVDNLRVDKEEISKSLEQIPFVWIFKLDPYFLLKSIALLLGGLCMYHMISFSSYKGKDMIFQQILTYVYNLPSLWFSPLVILYSSPEIITKLTSTGLFQPASGSPPSFLAKCESLKNCVIKIIGSKNLMLESYIWKTTRWVEFSWFWITVCSGFFSNEFSLSEVSKSREIIPSLLMKESGGTINLKWMLTHYQNVRKLEIEDQHLVNLILTMNNHPVKFLNINLDFLSKCTFPDEAIVEQSIPTVRIPLIDINRTVNTFIHISQKTTDLYSWTEEVSLQKLEFNTSITDDLSFLTLLKPTSGATTSIYKSLGLVAKCKLQKIKRIVCLGDGGGGFSIASQCIYPSSRVVYSSLLKITDIGPQGLQGYIPTDYYYVPQLLQKLEGTDDLAFRNSNILSSNMLSWLAEQEASTFLISDAELPFNSLGLYAEAIKNITDIIRQNNWEGFMIKLYIESRDAFKLILFYCQANFQQVQVLRSAFSNENQYEVYLVCRGYQRLLGSPYLSYNDIERKLHVSCNISPCMAAMVEKTLSQGFFQDLTSELLSSISCEISTYLISLGLLSQVTPKEFPHLPLIGIYPLSSRKTIDQSLKVSNAVSWSSYKRMNTSVPNWTIASRIAEEHLIMLGGLIKDSSSFQSFLNIVKHGFLNFWVSRKHVWRSGISFKEFYSSMFMSYKLSTLIKRPQIKGILKTIGLLQRNSCFISTRYLVSLSHPLGKSKFSDKYWYKKNQLIGYSFFDLPLDFKAAYHVFNSSFEKVRAITADIVINEEPTRMTLMYPTSERILRVQKMLSSSSSSHSPTKFSSLLETDPYDTEDD